MAGLATNDITDPTSKQESHVADTLAERALELNAFQEEKTVEKIQQLGGKFAIMYMLWMSNTQATFQTMPDPNYVPMDRFVPSLESKRQGELADLCSVFPEEYHKNFMGDFIHPIVCFCLLLVNALLTTCFFISFSMV